jgi:flagellar protein FliT
MSPKTATPLHTALPPYRAIEHTSARMVAAALMNQWAEVTRLETVAREQVAALRKLPVTAPLNPAERQARLAALKAILRHDAQVRALADPRWLKVQGWLGRQGQAGGFLADTDSQP